MSVIDSTMSASLTNVIALLLCFLTQVQHIECLTDYLINPSDVHSILGTTAQFRCVYAHHTNGSAHLAWRFNFDNAEVTHIIDKMVTTTHSSTTHGGTDINSTLTVEVTNTGYNGTEVYCLVAITETARTEESEVAKLYVTDVPDIEKPTLTAFTNGTLRISWDALSIENTLAVLREDQVSYDLVILSGSGVECQRMENISHDILSYDLIPSNLTCNEQSLHECESISVYLTPIINNEFSGTRTKVSTAIQPFTLVQNEDDAVMIANDTFEFSYRINTTVPLSFCIVEVNLTNVISGEKYRLSIDAITMEAGPTNDLRVTVPEHSVPFDNHYIAVVSLGNGYHNETQTAENNISLSTYAIQNVSQQDNHLVIYFVQGTSSQGAFIVCNNTEGFEFNYSIASRNDEHDTAELETAVEGSKCSILVYDVRNDGLLIDKDKEELRPSYTVHNQPCIMRAIRNSTQAPLRISAKANAEEGLIMFECKVTDVSLDTKGCIAIVHDSQDYSTLLVNNIPRDTPSINVPVEGGKNYSYVIFEWAESGLLSSQILKSGMLPVAHNESPTYFISTVGYPRHPKPNSHIILILLPVFVSILCIIVTANVAIILAYCARKTKTLRITHHSKIENEDCVTKSAEQHGPCESEEESLIKDETSDSEVETIIDDTISVPTERAFYDAPGKLKLLENETGTTGKDFKGVSATHDGGQWRKTATTTSREKIQKELKD